MRRLQPAKELLISWRRCVEKGVPNNASSALFNVEGDSLECKKQANKLLLSIFGECVHKVDGLITGEHIFLLVSPEGILLKKSSENYLKKKR